METKIVAIYSWGKALVINNKFIGGLALGYVGYPVIKVTLLAVGEIVKEVLKLI